MGGDEKKISIPCIKPRDDQQEAARDIFINQNHAHKGYRGNYTSTSKYNAITFFPKALFEQYRRLANLYFTASAALSTTPYSPVRPWTTFLPLVLVIGVAMLKEGIEDWKRHKADHEVNNRKVNVLNPETKEFEERQWKDIKVGDIVEVLKDEFFPADLLFLTAENEDGLCYIETMNLDGETNLKIKKALDQTKGYTEATVGNFTGEVKCEGPNPRLYTFTGNLEIANSKGGSDRIPLSNGCILLRGCSLRNTDKIFGAVIYAGHDTKVFKNAMAPPSKRSRIEKGVDKIILFTFVLLFAFTFTGCFVLAWWTNKKMPKHWYLGPETAPDMFDTGNPAKVGAISFVTSFILYGYLIPISLYVSIEMVKVYQSMILIPRDREMYHKDTDTPALARTSNLQEELGMVTTVLSDKTGTLTRNVMEFFKCSIGGVAYGAGVTEVERANEARFGRVLTTTATPEASKYRERFFNFYDSRIMGGAWKSQPHAELIEEFFRLLAICHTVIPDIPKGETPTPTNVKYEAESPDESALVVAAKVFGFFFKKRTNTTVTVSEDGVDREYEILNILEFNSTRKRMSVIFRDPEGRLRLYCKGADTVIYERLDKKFAFNEEMKRLTGEHMEQFGSAGLRTLCLSYTEIDPEFYDQWQEEYIAAKTSLVNRQDMLDAASEKVEKNLRLLGCTAIEDKLQEGVPACIARLAEAGIRLWVLTGDKVETAINIGYACSLLNDSMEQYKVSLSHDLAEDIEKIETEVAHLMTGLGHSTDPKHKEKVLKEVKDLKEQANEIGVKNIKEQLSHALEGMQQLELEDVDKALVIDGKALQYGLHPECKDVFLEVGLACKAVICCRVSPKQKADVTSLVKGHGDITLAIGDGANDVGMIQKAHIGVGISGQEGMQAVMSADFAIAQFRFLEPLLLVHGHYSYKRISRMVNFFFYKNLFFGSTLFAYNACTVFSGQLMYNDFYMTLYNVIFTSVTPIVIGAFDMDVARKYIKRFPALYKEGQLNFYFSRTVIITWIVVGLQHAAIAMAMVMCLTRATLTDRENGTTFGIHAVGATMFSAVILTVHLEIITVLEHWTIFHHISIWGSILIWWAYLLAYGAFPLTFALDLYDLFLGVLAPSPQYWLIIAVVPIACVLPDFFIRQCRRLLAPEYHHVVQDVITYEEQQRRAMGHSLGDIELPRTTHGGTAEVTPVLIKTNSNNLTRVPTRRNTGCVIDEPPGSPSFFQQDRTPVAHPVTSRLAMAQSLHFSNHRHTPSAPAAVLPSVEDIIRSDPLLAELAPRVGSEPSMRATATSEPSLSQVPTPDASDILAPIAPLFPPSTIPRNAPSSVSSPPIPSPPPPLNMVVINPISPEARSTSTELPGAPSQEHLSYDSPSPNRGPASTEHSPSRLATKSP